MTTITKAGRAVRLIPARPPATPPAPQRHGAKWDAATFDSRTAGKPLSRAREACIKMRNEFGLTTQQLAANQMPLFH